MKTNVSINLTDEQRAIIHANFYGGKKGLISRKDVNTICQTAITDWLMNRNNGPEQEEDVAPLNLDDVNIEDVMKQNELLLKRVNDQQNFIDRKLNKK